MNFTPMTEEEAQPKNTPWPIGEYSFHVAEADEFMKYDAENNPIDWVKFKLAIYSEENPAVSRWINDRIPLQKLPWKFRHACFATGLEEKYATGQIHAQDFVGRSGRLRLGVRTNQKDPKYNGLNEVKDYIAPEPAGKVEMPPNPKPSAPPWTPPPAQPMAAKPAVAPLTDNVPHGTTETEDDVPF